MTTTERKAAGQMGGEIDSVAALSAAERLVRLFKDPQPGMATWCIFLATAMADFDKAICCLPDSVEMAAPDLLAACELAEEAFRVPAGTSPEKEIAALSTLRAAIAKAKAK